MSFKDVTEEVLKGKITEKEEELIENVGKSTLKASKKNGTLAQMRKYDAKLNLEFHSLTSTISAMIAEYCHLGEQTHKSILRDVNALVHHYNSVNKNQYEESLFNCESEYDLYNEEVKSMIKGLYTFGSDKESEIGLFKGDINVILNDGETLSDVGDKVKCLGGDLWAVRNIEKFPKIFDQYIFNSFCFSEKACYDVKYFISFRKGSETILRSLYGLKGQRLYDAKSAVQVSKWLDELPVTIEVVGKNSGLKVSKYTFRTVEEIIGCISESAFLRDYLLENYSLEDALSKSLSHKTKEELDVMTSPFSRDKLYSDSIIQEWSKPVFHRDIGNNKKNTFDWISMNLICKSGTSKNQIISKLKDKQKEIRDSARYNIVKSREWSKFGIPDEWIILSKMVLKGNSVQIEFSLKGDNKYK